MANAIPVSGSDKATDATPQVDQAAKAEKAVRGVAVVIQPPESVKGASSYTRKDN